MTKVNYKLLPRTIDIFLFFLPGNCNKGFICFKRAVDPNPTPDVDWGRLCAAGFFCPEGTTIERPCPEGTYKYEYIVTEVLTKDIYAMIFLK